MFNGFFFVVRFEGVVDRIVSIETPKIIIGRDTSCGLRLVHDCVSRTHARVEHTDNGYLLHDLNSHNHTLVNQRRVVDHHLLRACDVVRIVPFSLKFFLDRDHATADADALEESTQSSAFEPDPATIREELKWQLPPSLHAVYEALMDGHTEKEIEQVCALSKSRAHYSIRRIYDILEVHSHIELLAECRGGRRRMD